MELLNITQRQMCESLAQKFIQSSTKADGVCSFLSVVIAHNDLSEPLVMSAEELIAYGVLNENMSFGRCVIFDDGYETQYTDIANPITFRAVDETWTEGSQCNTIKDYLDSVGATTMLEAFGNPIMETCNSSGSATILDYCRKHYDYHVSASSSKLVLIYKGTQYDIANFVFDGDSCYITPIINDELLQNLVELCSCFGLCGQINALYGAMAEALAGNTCTPSDLYAVLQRFVGSKWGAVKSIVNDLLRAGASSVLEAVNNFIYLFRTMNDYTENNDGSLTWNTPGSKINNSAWLVAAQIATSAAQIVGYSLLMLGGIAAKLVGGALVIASSIGQAIMNAVGQVSGTAPSIYDEAIDDVYGDPLFQGVESVTLSYLQHASETLANLRENGRAKIIAPWCIVYLYNAKIENDVLTAAYKIYLRCRSAYGDLYAGDQPYGSSYKGNLFSYVYNDPGLGASKRYGFFPTDGWSTAYAFLNISDRCVNRNNVLDITRVDGNAANADSWKNLWKTVFTNAVYTMSMVFSSVFYKHGDTYQRVTSSTGNWCDNRYDDAIINILKGINGVVYDPVDGSSTDLVNGIGSMAAIDHADDNILFCALSTLGIIDISKEDCEDMLSGTNVYCSYDAAQNIWSASHTAISIAYTDVNPKYGSWYDGLYYSLPFTAIDKYSYIIPPSHSYTSVLWGAIIAAGVVALVATSIYVTRAIIGKKVRLWMQRRGQALLAEGQPFRTGWTVDEWSQLSSADKAEYNRAFKAYNFKVKLYNFGANLLNLQSLDWVNNWWNPADSVGAIPAVVASTQGSTIPELLNTDAVNQVTTAGLGALGYDVSQSFTSTDDKVALVSGKVSQTSEATDALISDLFYLISGRHPS